MSTEVEAWIAERNRPFQEDPDSCICRKPIGKTWYEQEVQGIGTLFISAGRRMAPMRKAGAQHRNDCPLYSNAVLWPVNWRDHLAPQKYVLHRRKAA